MNSIRKALLDGNLCKIGLLSISSPFQVFKIKYYLISFD